MKSFLNFAAVAAVLTLFLGGAGVSAVQAQQLHIDPKKVTGPDACGECHKETIKAWRETHHFSTFQNLPRTDKAHEIAEKMGIRRIKSEGDCLSCHFTSQTDDAGTDQVIAGISCESCHGAGKDYIKVHSNYGGKDTTKETETPEHRTQRWKDSEAAGMIRPGDLYKLAENCFQCHTVPNEKLVNTGGHTAGSPIELVSWSQGEVRHNVWYTPSNDAASPERQRMLLVVGQLLDLEYSLRGVAEATEKASYAVTMAKRAQATAGRVKKLSDLLGGKVPELNQVLEAMAGAKLKLNNKAELLGVAEKVKASAQAFAANYDGSTFAALDAVIPGPDKYKGKVY